MESLNKTSSGQSCQVHVSPMGRFPRPSHPALVRRRLREPQLLRRWPGVRNSRSWWLSSEGPLCATTVHICISFAYLWTCKMGIFYPIS